MQGFEEPRRFWSKVAIGEPNECWEWQAYKKNKGYGEFWVHSRMWVAHRVAWTLTFGPIPEGLCVCHHCDNRSCCNPYHLFLGTHAENVADSVKKGRRAKGSRTGSSRLTKEDILAIRELYASGEWTQQEIEEEFGVSSQSISAVVRGQYWGWLKENNHAGI